MAGDDAVGKFKQVEFENGGNNGNLVALEDFARDVFASVDAVAEMVCGGEGNVDNPDATSSFVAFEVRVV